MKRTRPPVHLGNESSMIRALADHYKANYCAPYGGEFNREAFLHWVDVNLPGELLRDQREEPRQ